MHAVVASLLGCDEGGGGGVVVDMVVVVVLQVYSLPGSRDCIKRISLI